MQLGAIIYNLIGYLRGLYMLLMKKVHFIVTIALILINVPVIAQNRISVTGKVSNIDGKLLADAVLSLSKQNKIATSNRFGEFDLGKIFTNDTVIVNIPGYQSINVPVSSEINFTLYPTSEIRERINNARQGEIVSIPSGIHYLYPDFRSDSTIGVHITNKRDLTIRGETGSEINGKPEIANATLTTYKFLHIAVPP